MHIYSIIRDHDIIHHSKIIKEIEEDSEEEVEEEEALEEVEDLYFFTTIKNLDDMLDIFHSHLQHVCIVAQQTMRQKIV
jgi:hypothetical protein